MCLLISLKGTDITESFEVHHIHAERAEKRLAEFYVREAAAARNVKLTFHPDGFYRTLKHRVANIMQTIDRKPEEHTKVFVCVYFLQIAMLNKRKF